MNKATRVYSMKTRAEAAGKTEQKILQALVDLWMEMPLTTITLEKIAEKSGITVRTILRKFNSRENLLDVCIEKYANNFKMKRNEAEKGNISQALQLLINEYEEMGEAVMRTIALETEYASAAKILQLGRKNHKEWCTYVFEPFLPQPAHTDYEEKLAAFIAATEIYLWKLLRKDMKMSYEQTLNIFSSMVHGLLPKHLQTQTNEQ